MEIYNMSLKRTFWMNIFLVPLWILFLLFAFNTYQIERSDLYLAITTIYSCGIISTYLFTALSLKFESITKLKLLAKIGNWCAVVFTAVYYVVATYRNYPLTNIDIIAYPIPFLVFAVPSIFNLKALGIKLSNEKPKKSADI